MNARFSALIDADTGLEWNGSEYVRTGKVHPADVNAEEVIAKLQWCMARMPAGSLAEACIEDALSEFRAHHGLTDEAVALARAERAAEPRYDERIDIFYP